MMNLRILLLTILFALALGIKAQSPAVQKAAKSVFTLTTYDADGAIIATTHGTYFVTPNEGIAAFKPFIGAYSAVIIDAQGNKSDVETIVGANDMYDICRFTLSKSTATPLPLCSAKASGQVYALGFSTKKAAITPLTIQSSETFLDKYNYYILNEEITEELQGCPIVNDNGELLGLVQRSGTTYAIHSTDSRYYSDLSSNGLASLDAVLQKTHLRISLPTNHEQARLMLMTFTASSDSLTVVNTTNDYISQYPDDIDGYSAQATYELQHNNLSRASAMLETAIKRLTAKDIAYYEYARLVYSKAVYGDEQDSPWTLQLAEENIRQAITHNNAPIYRHLLARIQFSLGNYAAALDLFSELTTTDIANSEIYYEVAQCKNMLNEPREEIMAYVEKAVESCPQPLTAISAPYILARGVMLDEQEDYKKALADYNLYDSLMNYRAEPDFYYMRGKCEVKVRQFQQAIVDYYRAIVLNPQEVTYIAELAALQLRVGQYDEALKACEASFNVTTEYSDIYIVQGLALQQLGRHDEAVAAWQHAAALDDPRGQEYIDKYQ